MGRMMSWRCARVACSAETRAICLHQSNPSRAGKKVWTLWIWDDCRCTRLFCRKLGAFEAEHKAGGATSEAGGSKTAKQAALKAKQAGEKAAAKVLAAANKKVRAFLFVVFVVGVGTRLAIT